MQLPTVSALLLLASFSLAAPAAPPTIKTCPYNGQLCGVATRNGQFCGASGKWTTNPVVQSNCTAPTFQNCRDNCLAQNSCQTFLYSSGGVCTLYKTPLTQSTFIKLPPNGLSGSGIVTPYSATCFANLQTTPFNLVSSSGNLGLFLGYPYPNSNSPLSWAGEVVSSPNNNFTLDPTKGCALMALNKSPNNAWLSTGTQSDAAYFVGDYTYATSPPPFQRVVPSCGVSSTGLLTCTSSLGQIVWYTSASDNELHAGFTSGQNSWPTDAVQTNFQVSLGPLAQ